MFDAITKIRSEEAANRRGDVDWDGHNLRANGGPPQLLQYGWNEERGAVACVCDAEVHQDAFPWVSFGIARLNWKTALTRGKFCNHQRCDA